MPWLEVKTSRYNECMNWVWNLEGVKHPFQLGLKFSVKNFTDTGEAGSNERICRVWDSSSVIALRATFVERNR